MKNLSTYLLVMFMFMYWVFRIIATVVTEYGQSIYGITVENTTFEYIVLFITLFSMVFVAKRRLWAGIIYTVTYFIYFGPAVFNSVMSIITPGYLMSLDEITSFIVNSIAIIIPVAVMIDILLDKGRKLNPVDKKTDWFYKNEEFDRKMDDRADKNNYRTL